MGPLLVIPAPIGQLGNRLTHFAHVRAFAIQHGLALVHTAFHPYADSFVATERTLFSVFDPNGDFYESSHAHKLLELFKLFLEQTGESFPHIQCAQIRRQIENVSFGDLDRMINSDMRELVFAFGFVLRSWVEAQNFSGLKAAYLKTGDEAQELDTHPGLMSELNTGADSMILLDGWGYRCTHGLQLNRAAVLKALSPRSDLLDKANDLVARARQTTNSKAAKLIGLHIRRGDYAEWQGGKFFFSWEQYASVVEQIRIHFGANKFALLVCSNEAPPTGFLRDIPHQLGTDDPVVDMWALSACDFIIGPTSTFTGWASNIAGAQFVPINESVTVEF